LRKGPAIDCPTSEKRQRAGTQAPARAQEPTRLVPAPCTVINQVLVKPMAAHATTTFRSPESPATPAASPC